MHRSALLLLLVACGPDPSDPRTEDESDDDTAVFEPEDTGSGEEPSSDSGEPDDPEDDDEDDPVDDEPDTASVLTLAEDEVAARMQVDSVVSGDLAISAAGVSGTLDYRESEDGFDTCAASLAVTSVPTTDCEGCTWGHELRATATPIDGTCAFLSGRTALDLADETERAFFAWFENTDFWGTPYDEMLLFWVEETDDEGSGLMAWEDGRQGYWGTFDPDAGSLRLKEDGVGSIVPLLYEVCDLDAESFDTGLPADEALSGSVACDRREPRADVYTVALAAGERLRLRDDQSSPRPDVALRVVEPGGCLAAWGETRRCGESGGDCPALDVVAATEGTYRVVVEPTSCGTADRVDYRLEASME